MSILNICDYKDEKENIYYKELQKCFGAKTHIISVVFEKDKNPAELLMQLMTERYDLIVGHGFGGVLALYIGRATNVKTILINPAYPASRYCGKNTGVCCHALLHEIFPTQGSNPHLLSLLQ